ncbi:hypothetical protein MRB53_041846 [Persea americana]|nr:hypothetical protein MRB53_041846 [Persea americana]
MEDAKKGRMAPGAAHGAAGPRQLSCGGVLISLAGRAHQATGAELRRKPSHPSSPPWSPSTSNADADVDGSFLAQDAIYLDGGAGGGVAGGSAVHVDLHRPWHAQTAQQGRSQQQGSQQQQQHANATSTSYLHDATPTLGGTREAQYHSLSYSREEHIPIGNGVGNDVGDGIGNGIGNDVHGYNVHGNDILTKGMMAATPTGMRSPASGGMLSPAVYKAGAGDPFDARADAMGGPSALASAMVSRGGSRLSYTAACRVDDGDDDGDRNEHEDCPGTEHEEDPNTKHEGGPRDRAGIASSVTKRLSTLGRKGSLRGVRS